MDTAMQAAIDAAKQNNPDVELLQLSSASGDVVLRVPAAAEVAVFRKRIMDKETRSSAIENLVRTCLVFPAREAFNALVQKRPFLIEKYGEKLTDAAGDSEEVEVKKL
jgi:hypothetical protein